VDECKPLVVGGWGSGGDGGGGGGGADGSGGSGSPGDGDTPGGRGRTPLPSLFVHSVPVNPCTVAACSSLALHQSTLQLNLTVCSLHTCAPVHTSRILRNDLTSVPVVLPVASRSAIL